MPDRLHTPTFRAPVLAAAALSSCLVASRPAPTTPDLAPGHDAFEAIAARIDPGEQRPLSADIPDWAVAALDVPAEPDVAAITEALGEEVTWRDPREPVTPDEMVENRALAAGRDRARDLDRA